MRQTMRVTGRVIASLTAWVLVGGVANARTLEFDGSFAEAQSSDALCDDVFAVDAYQAKHTLLGPSRRTSVLRFDGAAAGSFFEGVTFVGLLGGANDVYYEKTIQRDGVAFEVLAEGMISVDALYLEFAVRGVDEDGQTLCEATANYTGYN